MATALWLCFLTTLGKVPSTCWMDGAEAVAAVANTSGFRVDSLKFKGLMEANVKSCESGLRV